VAGVAALVVLVPATPSFAATAHAKPHAKSHAKPQGHTIRSADPAPVGARALVEAARHLGAPYVYGATGPNAFDCSGFVRYVFGRVGVALPRTAAEQYAAVRHLPDAQRQPGDLIFFRLGGGGIDHVGIYAGNNEIIVAPKTGDHIRYQAIWTSYQVGRIG
jgi:cell wall-associated NlpC family hydrolase